MTDPARHTPAPDASALAAELEAARHAIAVLELEKAREKLKAKTLALRLSRAEVLLKRVKQAGYV